MSNIRVHKNPNHKTNALIRGLQTKIPDPTVDSDPVDSDLADPELAYGYMFISFS
jgi:hypothetical protein